MYKEFWILSEWCSHRLVISIWVWSKLENLNSVKLTMKLSGCSYCSCCENLLDDKCKFVAKALNLSMRLLRKDALSMKLLRKPELSINICRESLYVINVAFGYEKNIPARRAGKKIILLRFCPKKNSRPGPKFQAPPWISNGPCLRSHRGINGKVLRQGS